MASLLFLFFDNRNIEEKLFLIHKRLQCVEQRNKPIEQQKEKSYFAFRIRYVKMNKKGAILKGKIEHNYATGFG